MVLLAPYGKPCMAVRLCLLICVAVGNLSAFLAKGMDGADSTARNGGAEATTSGRAPSPARRSISRVSSRSRTQYQPPTQALISSIRTGDSDRFSDAQELQARSSSYASKPPKHLPNPLL